MKPYNEKEASVNKSLIEAHIKIHDPEFISRYHQFMDRTSDMADKMRIESAFAEKTRELREKGFIPSNKELEPDVRRMALLEDTELAVELEGYEKGLRDYEGNLKKWSDR